MGAVLAIWCFWAIPALAESPTEYVRGILDRVIAIQTNPALVGEAHEAQRSRQIHQIIERSFDFPFMAAEVLGGVSGQVSAGQRQEFTPTFSYLFEDSYTRMVLNFLHEGNITYDREKLEGSKARVDTTIVRPNESIPVTYLMHQVGGGWRLYDVIIDGVSILGDYRTQFTQVIRTKGFGFLMERLRTQLQAVQ
jgi:phospholipid transport system substrate-binding protein